MPTDDSRRVEVFRELSGQECTTRLGGSVIGRIAVCTPDGPVVIPVNYVMDGESVIVRTAPYGLLAGYAWGLASFEIDAFDDTSRRGWSVLVMGQATPVEDVDEVMSLQLTDKLVAWAPGSRNMFIRITPRSVTGREVGR